MKCFAYKLALSENMTFSKRVSSTCWDRTVDTYKGETGIRSQKCPSYLGAACVAATAAVTFLCDGRDKEMITLMVLLVLILE